MISLVLVVTTIAGVLGSVVLYPIIRKIRRRSAKPRPDRIQVLSDPQNANFEIVAVHGLGAHPEYTWICDIPANAAASRRHADRPEKVHLLRDLLVPDFPKARILHFAYNSDWLIDAPVKTAHQIGDRLLAQLKANRPSRLPIIFVGHSFGGIIIKEALCSAWEGSLEIRDDTSGIVFLGTPHQGSSVSIVGAALAFLTGFLGSNTTLLLSLRRHQSQLTDLECRFRSYMDQEGRLNRSKIISFCETMPTYFLKWFSVGVVVDEDSALGPSGQRITINTDHSGLNKCSDREDELYDQLSSAIKRLRVPSLLEQADAWIRDKHYTADRLKIERLSGMALAMEQCYINLAIVEHPRESADRSEKGSGEGDTASQASPFSLPARLKVEKPDRKIQVELPTIFNQRKARDGNMTQPRRILIRGRAGVGKTTLCKKIVHEFTHGVWSQWSELFDRVLWVPLRNLKLEERHQVPGYSFFYLFRHEYFSLPSDREDLARALERTERSRTLFLLDGLDELSQDLKGESGMSRFLKELLSQPNVIVTSRPHGLPPDLRKPFDLELETIGFYTDQVNEYLQKAISDPQITSKVQSFLRDHQLIQGLVRIPIQLDALCFTWNEGFQSETKLDTMTAVYQAIELRLWKKDILRLDKQHNGRPVTEPDIQGSDPSEIEDLVKDEIYFLEALAFTELHNDLIDFESGHRNVMSKHFKPSTFLLDKTLPRLSFLRTSDPKHRNRSYHFLHLTFQEYFAARYFVRQWKSGESLKCLKLSSGSSEETKPALFLQKHKYTARYDILWRFVAGLLDAEKKAEEFFEIIEKEPLDLLGPTHQRLVMHCLSEVSAKIPHLEEKLSQWLRFECNFRQSAQLASEVEFPEQALCNVLQQGLEDVNITILRSLKRRPTIPLGIANLTPPWLGDNISGQFKREVLSMLQHFHTDLPYTVLRAVAARLEDEDRNVRRAAAEALGHQSNLPEAILAAVAARLENEDGNVRRAAAEALGHQSNLPEAILAAVAARLENEDGNVRWAAVKALSRQSNLPEAILAAMAVRLEDEDGNVRWAAVKALGRQSNLPEAILAAMAVRLEDEDGNVKRAAVKALGRQSNLPEAILAAMAVRLEDEDGDVRWAAVKALGRQSNLPEAILAAVAARLEDNDDYVKRAAVWAILGTFLHSGPFVGSLYKVLLWQSFETHWSWCVEEGISYFHMPHGVKNDWIDKDKFWNMVNKARPENFPSMNASQ